LARKADIPHAPFMSAFGESGHDKKPLAAGESDQGPRGRANVGGRIAGLP
jgi:hypothetical protein